MGLFTSINFFITFQLSRSEIISYRQYISITVYLLRQVSVKLDNSLDSYKISNVTVFTEISSE